MLTATEFLTKSIEGSNIPNDFYTYEISSIMEDYANYYHAEKLKEESLDNLGKGLDRIEEKIDKILDRGGKC